MNEAQFCTSPNLEHLLLEMSELEGQPRIASFCPLAWSRLEIEATEKGISDYGHDLINQRSRTDVKICSNRLARGGLS